MKTWQLQDAKAHLSKVVQQAISQGPQEISLRGEPVVIVISRKAYEKLMKPKLSFVQFMQQSPLSGTSIQLKRDQSKVRNVDL